ncbi:MAG: hydrogenase maturation nickel metallochaperone HypA [candidate division KSB1 bacterium]|nr:hydrogenase maturation nickel metallochaperone HypA [candidate division KSB1 bacterium]
MSLIAAVLRGVEAKLAELGARRVRSIRLAVGILSGAEPALLESAFAALSPGTPCEGARLEIRRPPLRLRCRSCGNQEEQTEFALSCRLCRSPDVELEGGDELLVEEMEVDFGDT